MRTIRFSFDWGHPWPLWEAGHKYAMEPTDYGLSDDLTQRLARLYELWAGHVQPDGDGWDSSAAEAQWLAEGREALAILRREVADTAVVVNQTPISG